MNISNYSSSGHQPWGLTVVKTLCKAWVAATVLGSCSATKVLGSNASMVNSSELVNQSALQNFSNQTVQALPNFPQFQQEQMPGQQEQIPVQQKSIKAKEITKSSEPSTVGFVIGFGVHLAGAMGFGLLLATAMNVLNGQQDD